MYNWNIETTTLKKSPQKYAIWKLEQLINFGLNGEKIKVSELKKYWSFLNLDPQRKQVLEFWLR
jgi:hypothetical protein